MLGEDAGDPAETESTVTFMSLLDTLLAALLRWLAAALAPLLPPRRPGRFTFRTREVITPMGKTFEITVQLPPLPQPNDIAKQELTVTANGTAQPAIELGPNDTEAVVGRFEEGATVEASLVYIDDSPNANRSMARVESTTVSDTEAPPEPGEFGFRVAQVFEPAPETPTEPSEPTA